MTRRSRIACGCRADARSLSSSTIAHLSGAVSFDPEATNNADRFASSSLPGQVNHAKRERREPQLITIATDGELYGHHKSFRDHFLARLVEHSAAANGFEVVTLARYLTIHQPERTVTLNTPSAWSCAHGVARWSSWLLLHGG